MTAALGFVFTLQHQFYSLKMSFLTATASLCCRWTVSMADSVAGGGEARRGESMP